MASVDDVGVVVRPCQKKDTLEAKKVFREGCVSNSQDIFRIFLHRSSSRLYISVMAFLAWLVFRSYIVAGSAIIILILILYAVSYIKSVAYAKSRLMADLQDITKNYIDNRRATFFVADDGGDIVGTISLSEMRSDPLALELQTLSVSRLYRRMGIGKTLIESAIQFGKKRRYTRILAHVGEYQLGAQAALAKSGFYLKSKKLVTFFAFFQLYQKIYIYDFKK
ncbi:N-acetyltransferase 8-like [Saccoglossus kowalevskii]|uniref:N-acetyltransferase 8-like n=1 Tax=Saccoglossus kowalevskii TaxID=10224 RepID=A0ABM0MKC4_SACKO|nr:PREDICTED: N-acetyltransferase 8-like [Saccoglossus kowalevskii]